MRHATNLLVGLGLLSQTLCCGANVSISTQPQPITSKIYGRAAFSVLAKGAGPLGYQWRKNGAPIGGQTNAGFIIGNLQLTDSGVYSVDVTDANETVSSDPATLTVTTPNAGDVDLSFDLGSSANDAIAAVAVQSDGGVLVGGDFTQINGGLRNRLARFNRDGTVDPTFGLGMTGADRTVRGILLQPEGQILIYGSFLTVNGADHGGVARLNADGSVDPSFYVGTVDGAVFQVALQNDGKLIVGGNFDYIVTPATGLVTVNGLARLNSDGSLDTSFTNSFPNRATYYAICLQPDGRIIAGGNYFNNFGLSRYFITRFNADGTLDTNFVSGTSGLDNTPYAVLQQPDGKILIGGTFASVNGTARNRLARLNNDGALDTNFVTQVVGGNSAVYSILRQTDDKILIGGVFTNVSGVRCSSTCRLNADGSVDTTYQTNAGISATISAMALQNDSKLIACGSITFNGSAYAKAALRFTTNGILDLTFQAENGGLSGGFPFLQSLSVQTDAKVLISGVFTGVDGQNRHYLARLNPDGTLDRTFQEGLAGLNNHAKSIVIQSDGKVVIGGSFTNVNGSVRNRIARLNTNGTTDTGFQNGMTGANDMVNAAALQSDNKIVIGGMFTNVNGSLRRCIARLNTDGTLDNTFQSSMAGASGGAGPASVNALVITTDGKIIIGGNFTNVNGLRRSNIAQLNSDGSVDTNYLNGALGAYSTVYSMCLQPDGKLLIGGKFNGVNGVARYHLARLNSDSSVDSSFMNSMGGTDGDVYSLAAQADGKVLIGGIFTTFNGFTCKYLARLNADGSFDTSFAQSTPINNTVDCFALQPDGKILVGGAFTMVGNIVRTCLVRLYSCDMPALTTFVSGSSTVVSWPATATNFVLEAANNPTAANSWFPVTSGISSDGTRLSVTFDSSAAPLFFRLKN